MSILVQLDRALVHHHEVQGKKPRCIYLGAEEWMALRQRAQEMGFKVEADAVRDPSLPRLEYRGSPVFRVDVKNHLEML